MPARVPVQAFAPNRNQKRILARNRDLEVGLVEHVHADEHYDLYARYITARHRDGDMYPPDREQYRSFLTREWGTTSLVEFRAAGRLLAVAVMDRLDNGLSAIYTFFDPQELARSLGTFVILWQVALARELDLPALYLGYWIRNCRKMNYKTRFRPVELLANGHWVRVD